MHRLLAILLLHGCSFSGSSVTGSDDAAPPAFDGSAAPVVDAAMIDSPPEMVLSVFRVNVAGPAFEGIDRPGTWAADDNGEFCFGNIDIVELPVQNTNDDELFQRMRFGPADDDIGCDFPLANGDYTVVLHLAEIFRGGNCEGSGLSRDYTIRIEGSDVDRFELVSENGGCVADPLTPNAAPITRRYPASVADGVLNLTAGMPADRALLQAVEILTRP